MNGAEISATAALAGSALGGLPILATVLRESFVKPEVDETFIGGKARNMHKDVRSRRITGTGGKDNRPVDPIHPPPHRPGHYRLSGSAEDHRDSSRPELRRIVRVGAAARDQHSSRKWDQLNCRHSVATIPMMRRYEVTLCFSEGVSGTRMQCTGCAARIHVNGDA